jgi:hypothetical protein
MCTNVYMRKCVCPSGKLGNATSMHIFMQSAQDRMSGNMACPWRSGVAAGRARRPAAGPPPADPRSSAAMIMEAMIFSGAHARMPWSSGNVRNPWRYAPEAADIVANTPERTGIDCGTPLTLRPYRETMGSPAGRRAGRTPRARERGRDKRQCRMPQRASQAGTSGAHGCHDPDLPSAAPALRNVWACAAARSAPVRVRDVARAMRNAP